MTKNKESILYEALDITNKRVEDYGTPIENLDNIARLWDAYIKSKKINSLSNGTLLTSKDVAMMMILLKISRETSATKEDNLIDIAGYCRLASVIEEYEII